ncbi:DMT family transporter [Roseibacterium sp. SDUM158017]|uniref:DMT family transporter n=1 Tax=Roseicyclus salinarum TaxID=3036773 RepID=UPI0024153FA5|nr:DMT family transporter [Roseibacterium sp. SDUM158017]MDG4647474.1 DMT family transporter [Roseibacterium sp. SDUM158017]
MSETPSISDKAAASAPGSRPVIGVFWMLVTGLCFVAVTATVKMVGDDVPAAQAAFLRYVLGLVFLVPMIPAMRAATLTPRVLKLFGLRGAAHALGVISWFYAMTRIPIAEVTAMNYLNPVYVTVLAVIVLGERISARRIGAVVLALIGALVILRPGFRELDPGHFAMLFTAASFAVGYLLAKILADEVPAPAVVFMLSVTVTLALAPFAYAVWVPVGWGDLGWLFLTAVFATGGHLTMTLAFRAAPLTVTQPVTFLQLVWATALGALVFAEPVDVFVILGGAMIIASVSYIALREAQLRRRVAAAGSAPGYGAAAASDTRGDMRGPP